MPRRNSTVEIADGKVVFSEEVLSYFDNLRTEENSIWINKYFEYLSDEENLTAEKYNGHHIIPCFVFKDENHKTRKETEFLADKVEGNIIKLSIYNHLLAHYCLWKIFNDWDSKTSFQQMCGRKKYMNDISEDELKEIAILKEECFNKNQTEEERKEYIKQWQVNNMDRLRKLHKIWEEKNKEKRKIQHHENYINNKERHSQNGKVYYENNKSYLLKKRKERYENNKEEYLKKNNEHKHQQCYDPIKENFCTYGALVGRKFRNKELYKNINISECIIQTSTPST